jgi:hypothetical protein
MHAEMQGVFKRQPASLYYFEKAQRSADDPQVPLQNKPPPTQKPSKPGGGLHMAQLKKLGKELGIKQFVGISKAELQRRITEAINAGESQPDSGREDPGVPSEDEKVGGDQTLTPILEQLGEQSEGEN